MQGTSGMELAYYAGDGSADQTIKVLRNLALNIGGRASDGNGGFSTTQYEDRQFVQLGHDDNLRDAEVAWNQVFNQPGNSRVEDNVSVYRTSGTADSHLLIHDNFIQGGYPAVPTASDYSGGGITLGDGYAADEVCAYIEAYGNQVLDTTNYGIAVTAGHDSSFHDNRVISAGTLPDGTPLPAQNVGIAVWKNNPGPFYNNSATNNVVGWAVVKKGGGAMRNDFFLPDTVAGTAKTNVSMPGPITPGVVQAEYARWRRS